MQIGKTIALIGAIAVVASAPLSGLQAADFPTKPIQLVVPFKPGGGSDLSARIFAKYASKYLPEKVIVQNIDGARGRTAELEVKRSRPDGYTLLWQHQNLHMAFATGRSKYDYTAFEPVADTVQSDNALIVAKDSPYKTPADLNKAAKDKPGTIRWGAAINGFSHFALLTYLDAADLGDKDFHIIGMSGDKDRIVAMLQGNLDAAIVALSSARPYLDSGDLRLLGTMNAKRAKAYPDLPTLKEQGIDAVFAFDYMTMAPKGTPADRLKIIVDAWMKTANDPACVKELNDGWMLSEPLSGADFDAFLKKEFGLYTRLAKKFNLVEPAQK